ncbi:MAG TPA: DJ-1/PfpI family protein [Ktedonobacteraceae bacterium]|jgi:transcriptional regulator GlxA family with amidase domain|nr:DJ-1/PfpI family protein [Ktedonobacteraceae bacterium]
MKTAILLYEGFTALDAIGPYEVLSNIPEMTIDFVGKDLEPKRTDKGFIAFSVTHTVFTVSPPDILVIPGGAGTFIAAQDTDILQWVQSVHRSSQWTTSVCSGALILGAAGILQELTATTHWAAQAELEAYGAIYVSERFVQHGKVITAAGVSAGIDMALHLAQEIVGQEMAQAIQLMIEYDPQPPFASGSLRCASPTTISLARQMVVQGLEQK